MPRRWRPRSSRSRWPSSWRDWAGGPRSGRAAWRPPNRVTGVTTTPSVSSPTPGSRPAIALLLVTETDLANTRPTNHRHVAPDLPSGHRPIGKLRSARFSQRWERRADSMPRTHPPATRHMCRRRVLVLGLVLVGLLTGGYWLYTRPRRMTPGDEIIEASARLLMHDGLEALDARNDPEAAIDEFRKVL